MKIINTPFLLKPIGKDYLWGGQKLNDLFAKDIPMNPLAETWECSVHPDGESVIASGEYQGKKLSAVLEEHPYILGSHPGENLPILVKLIDARDNLSVQVHPNDDYALKNEGELGKTEMWYVIETSDEASLIYGYNKNVTRDEIEKASQDGTIEKYLQKVSIKKDDIFFIPAGTVHAICKGALIAEIQENSNITYRLYDYDRVDNCGNKRQLHIKKALDVMNYSMASSPRQPLRVKRFNNGFCAELLCRCKYFQVERFIINTERTRKMAYYKTESNSCSIMLCTEGCGVIFWNGGMIDFYRGDCIFIPANSVELKLHGVSKSLMIGC